MPRRNRKQNHHCTKGHQRVYAGDATAWCFAERVDQNRSACLSYRAARYSIGRSRQHEPKAPYSLRTNDLLSLDVEGAFPDAPIKGEYAVEIGGMTLPESKIRIENGNQKTGRIKKVDGGDAAIF